MRILDTEPSSVPLAKQCSLKKIEKWDPKSAVLS